MQLTTVNQFLRKAGMPINALNVLVGLVISIFDVYIPIPSSFGLGLGITMALASSVGIGISYYFTTANTAPKKGIRAENRLPLAPTNASNTFLAIALPCMLLNTSACFFGMYTGTKLLIPALPFHVDHWAISTLPTGLGVLLTVGTLINSWLQTHNLWERLKKPADPSSEAFLSTTALLLESGLTPSVTPELPKPRLQRSISLPNLYRSKLDSYTNDSTTVSCLPPTRYAR